MNIQSIYQLKETQNDSHPLLEALGSHPSPKKVQRVVTNRLAKFLREEVEPDSTRRDEECASLSGSVFRKAAEKGLLNFVIPKEVGGLGGERRTFGLLLEQIGYHCEELAFPSLLAMYGDIPNTIYQTGNSDLISEYVVPMSRGERFGTFAFTDYGDALSFKTRVRKVSGDYVLNGEKCLQTGGALCDTFLTYVRDDKDDLKIFIVERGDPGVLIEPVKTLGMRSAGLTRLVLNNTKIPESRLLFQSDGLSQSQVFLNSRRLFIVCPFTGAMKAILEKCISHLKTVIREDRPLTEMQAVQGKIGKMMIWHETSQAVLHNALDHLESEDINPLFDPVISAAKYHITECAIALANQAIRLTGWRGYSKVLPFERYLRAFMGAITGHTAQDLLEIQLGINAISKVELKIVRKEM